MKPANNAPVYACFYAEITEAVRQHGYALTVHGSLARDLDCIAVPWIDDAASPQTVVDALVAKFAIKQVNEPSVHSHGRIVYTLSLRFGEVFVDLGFMPKAPVLPSNVASLQSAVAELEHKLSVANEYAALVEKRLKHADTECAQARVSRDIAMGKLRALYEKLAEMNIVISQSEKVDA